MPQLNNTSSLNESPFRVIIVIRHGKPALSRNIWLDWRGYRQWWKRYDEGGLAPQQKPPEALRELMKKTEYLFSSPMQRSCETAQVLNINRLKIHKDSFFVEAALPPPHFPSWFKLKPRSWGAVARMFWCLGWSDNMETQRQARIRAQKTAQRLIQTTETYQQVALTAHGWFNRMVKNALIKAGCRCIYQCGDGYWSWRVYHFPSEVSCSSQKV